MRDFGRTTAADVRGVMNFVTTGRLPHRPVEKSCDLGVDPSRCSGAYPFLGGARATDTFGHPDMCFDKGFIGAVR